MASKDKAADNGRLSRVESRGLVVVQVDGRRRGRMLRTAAVDVEVSAVAGGMALCSVLGAAVGAVVLSGGQKTGAQAGTL